jgi:hypothetical protein
MAEDADAEDLPGSDGIWKIREKSEKNGKQWKTFWPKLLPVFPLAARLLENAAVGC